MKNVQTQKLYFTGPINATFLGPEESAVKSIVNKREKKNSSEKTRKINDTETSTSL